MQTVSYVLWVHNREKISPHLGPASALSRPRRRSEEHTSELQSQSNLVCRLLLEKKKNIHKTMTACWRDSRRSRYSRPRCSPCSCVPSGPSSASAVPARPTSAWLAKGRASQLDRP